MSLKVNFSDKEASAEGRSFDPIPSGKYHAKVTDIEERECGPSSNNPGKPYWAIEFTIQDGPQDMRKQWSNCMLFEGALYTLVQLLKATGQEAAIKTGKVPDPEVFISKDVFIIVKKMRDRYAENPENGGDGETPQWKNEVKGIAKYTDEVASATASGSILP